ncbi:MAG: hypothetical protein ABH834_04280 [Candidatus Altiarchaeota archaeon]
MSIKDAAPETILGKTIVALTLISLIAYAHYNIEAAKTSEVVELTAETTDAFKASEDINNAQVYFTSQDGVKICELSAGGDLWRCSGNEWNYIGTSPHKLGKHLRRCVWAHPITNNTLHIIFEDVDLGSKVEGFYGIIDGTSTEDPGRVDFVVSVGDVDVYDGSTVNPGLKEFEFETGGASDIEFKVFTNKDVRRHFCFDAWASN